MRCRIRYRRKQIGFHSRNKRLFGPVAVFNLDRRSVARFIEQAQTCPIRIGLTCNHAGIHKNRIRVIGTTVTAGCCGGIVKLILDDIARRQIWNCNPHGTIVAIGKRFHFNGKLSARYKWRIQKLTSRQICVFTRGHRSDLIAQFSLVIPSVKRFYKQQITAGCKTCLGRINPNHIDAFCIHGLRTEFIVG